MLRPIAFLVAAILLTSCVQTAERFVTKRPSPLKRDGLMPPNTIVFRGQIQLSGVFYVNWYPRSGDFPGCFRVVFEPDKQSQGILPYDRENGFVREIWVRNTDMAVRSLLSREQQRSLATGKRVHAKGHVKVVLGGYCSGVDDDQRNYEAELVDVVGEPTGVEITAGTHDSDGCYEAPSSRNSAATPFPEAALILKES